jgi:hypothetical protein
MIFPEHFAVNPPKDPMIGGKARNALQGTKTALRRTVRAPFIIGVNTARTVCLMIHPFVCGMVAVWDAYVIGAQAIIIPFPFVFGLLHTPRDFWKRSHGENWDPTMRNYHHYNLEIDRNYLKKNGFTFDTEHSEKEKYFGGEPMINMIKVVRSYRTGKIKDAEKDFLQSSGQTKYI